MATIDKVYAFNKTTKIGHSLGEIQSNFNMSFVIDGTKDSAKVIVWNYDEVEVEPYTLIYHPNTNSWWVVSHDKVERNYSENGYLYIHNLELVGAIDILNARDLTDCGFNQKTYTIQDFINRLFKLSGFEFDVNINADNTFLSKQVDFVKTFENYTLLSAIREFLDAYNMVAKLSFVSSYFSLLDIYGQISSATITLIPKTGDRSLTKHYDTFFENVQETRTMDKNSFGACVVSNAENVISTKAKTFPLMGAIPLKGTENKTNSSNAVIRLPSKVYKVNWLKMVYPTFTPTITYPGFDPVALYDFKNTAYNITEQQLFLNALWTFLFSKGMQEDEFNNIKETIIERLKGITTYTFYGDSVYDAVKDEIHSLNNNPIPEMQTNLQGLPSKKIALFDNETRSLLARTWQGIYWQRGSDLIKGFDFADNSAGNNIIFTSNTDFAPIDGIYAIFSITLNGITYKINVPHPTYFYLYDYKVAGNRYGMRFIINYIPMSDIKIKIDNTRNKNDIQLYNQNGKLTDNVALSKLLNSYAKEISSDTITKYMYFYNFNDVPKVGSIVYVQSDDSYDEYVINNVSLDFSINENKKYYIEGEFTMSKYFSTKSLMVNPNTNIRDYGIPQSFSVRRKQVYRDYYEITYTTYSDANVSTPYLAKDLIFDFNNKPNDNRHYISFIKIKADFKCYESGTEEDVDYAYFQLETSTYDLEKTFYIIVDFKDNNIIGYDNQSVYSGFDITNIITPEKANINTPVSYVDSLGKFESIELLFANSENIIASNQSAYYGNKVFIDETLYNAINNNSNYRLKITENEYNKDAIEVPVFEYACQINDTNDVLVGNNILVQEEDCIYFYSYIQGNENEDMTQDNVQDNSSIQIMSNPNGYRLDNGVKIEYADNQITLSLYSHTFYNSDSNLWVYGIGQSPIADRDLAIFKHSYNIATGEEIVDLMFICKKVPSEKIDNYKIYLKTNYYKLK